MFTNASAMNDESSTTGSLQSAAPTNGESASTKAPESTDSTSASPASAPEESRKREPMDAVDALTKDIQGSSLDEIDSSATKHRFWSTQPVPQTDQRDDPEPREPAAKNSSHAAAIMPNETFLATNATREAESLPAGLEWCTMDISDPKQLKEVHELLLYHYVADKCDEFRFAYRAEILKWAMTGPESDPMLHLGVRGKVDSKKKANPLVAFICAIPVTLSCNNTELRAVEVNFLCVVTNLRSRRLAPVLIREITRRSAILGYAQAIYTAGMKLPGSIGNPQYYHRTLDYVRLVNAGLIKLPPGFSASELQLASKTPSHPQTPGFRAMTKADVPQVRKKLGEFLGKYHLYQLFKSDKEVEHWFLPRPRVVESFVVDDQKKPGELSHFITYFEIPLSILHEKMPQNTIRVAFGSYYFYPAGPKGKEEENLVPLMRDCLAMARQRGIQLFNTLEIMDNTKSGAFDKLGFNPGTGFLYYYLYNWQCRAPLDGTEIGFVAI